MIQAQSGVLVLRLSRCEQKIVEPERVDEPLQFAGVAGELSGGVLDNLAHVGISVVELPNPRIDLAPNNLRLETPTQLLTLGRVEPMLPS